MFNESTVKPTVTLMVEPIVAEYMIHLGAKGVKGAPVNIQKIQGLDKLLKRYLTKQPITKVEPGAKLKKKQANWVTIELDVPYWTECDVRVYNYLLYTTYSIINDYVLESLIMIDLCEDLNEHYKGGAEIQILIEQFCLEKGIGFSSIVYERLKKRFYRFRLGNRKRKKV